MNEKYVKEQMEDVEKNKVKGMNNVKKVEQRLKDISDYLDSYFGPAGEESFQELYDKYKKNSEN